MTKGFNLLESLNAGRIPSTKIIPEAQKNGGNVLSQKNESPTLGQDLIFAELIPKHNITAYELARLLPYFLGAPLDERQWKKLGKKVTRHLRIGKGPDA